MESASPLVETCGRQGEKLKFLRQAHHNCQQQRKGAMTPNSFAAVVPEVCGPVLGLATFLSCEREIREKRLLKLLLKQ
jgi:hypothetical protein